MIAWTLHRRWAHSLAMDQRSETLAEREPERHYGLSLVQVMLPFLILGAVILLGLALTAR